MLDFIIILVEPEFEETIGFTARAMKNFGLQKLRLVNPRTTISNVAHSRASHAQEILDQLTIHSSLADALMDADLSVATTSQIAHSSWTLARRPMTPKGIAVNLISTTGTVGLVFGREGTGLSNSELGICDMLVTIPCSFEYRTLNLSHAAAILFYELFQINQNSPQLEVLANGEIKQVILDMTRKLASLTGLRESKVGITVKAMRNILGRSAIRRREASVLAGVLRRILEIAKPKEIESTDKTITIE